MEKKSYSGDMMEKLVSLCKRRGFIYQGSEIYGGLAGIYDFGPHGVELLNNLKRLWWNASVYQRENWYGLDSGMFKSPRVWEASGHTTGFSDPLAECRKCNSRIRVDKALEAVGVVADEKISEKEINELFDAHRSEISCEKCGAHDFSPVRKFNLLVKSNLGDFTSGDSEPVYLPGEACQGIYLDYKNIIDSMHPKIPFGVAQIGKAFRNEISPRNFLFRTREFEQADTQLFVKPHENKEAYDLLKQERWAWYLSLGIKEDSLRFKQHENLVFYAADAWDIEYRFPWGFDELEGVHDRTDYDLTQHMKFSNVDLRYTDPETGDKYIPWILETSMGMGRLFLAVLTDAYTEDIMGDSPREYLKLHPRVAPIKAAVSPLLKNKPELVAKAREVYTMLKQEIPQVMWDDNGNVGKRYRRQDEIGTPFCIVIDFDTLGDLPATASSLNKDAVGRWQAGNPEHKDTVTVRDRDTGEQQRMAIGDLTDYIKKAII